MIKYIVTLTWLTLVYTSQASALGGGMDLKDGLFWHADRDHNQQITQEEAKEVYSLGKKEVFEKYDTSGEGVITKFEFYDYFNRRSYTE